MEPLERVKGDCANCEIASSFALGRFSEQDLDECTGCQAEDLSGRRKIIVELEERGRQVEIEIAENVAVFATRLGGFKGASL